MKAILQCDCSHRWSGWAPMILRIATGLVFAMHGYQKLTQMGLSGVSGFLDGLGFPIAGVFAVILIAVELLGGIALIIGACTHWAAKLTAIVAFVALVTVHASKGFFASAGGYEFVLMLLAASVSLVITGPGVYAVDNYFHKSGRA